MKKEFAHYRKTDHLGMTVIVNVKRQCPDMAQYLHGFASRRIGRK